MELAHYFMGGAVGNNTIDWNTLEGELVQVKSKALYLISQDIDSKQFINSLLKELKEKKPNDLELRAFLRGYLDNHAHLAKEVKFELFLMLQCGEWVLTVPKEFQGLKGEFTKTYMVLGFVKLPIASEDVYDDNGLSTNIIKFRGPNTFDLICMLYEFPGVYEKGFYQQALKVMTEVKGINVAAIPRIKICKMEEDAVLPSKNRWIYYDFKTNFFQGPSDVGYDLTIIRLHKVLPSGTHIYETGIVVQPDHGWYVKILPRSSFSETGWILPISEGVIDKTYIGTLKIPLLRVSPTAADLTLPYKGFQMIPHPLPHTILEITDQNQIIKTNRGQGGFGSTEGKSLA